MISIRRSVFETNSSSTHSISIIDYSKPKNERIPRNSQLYVVKEYGYSGNETLTSEVDKLAYIANIIATYLENYGYYGSKYPELENDENHSFELLISQNPFKWLKEVVEEYTETKIEFEKPNNKYFPYYEYAENGDGSIRDVFECDWEDEQSFKSYIRELIFNDCKVIQTNDNEW